MKKDRNSSNARTKPLPGHAVIVCGEQEVRDVIAYWLTDHTTKVVVASDGYEATQALKQRDCRWLITDRVLPPWPGLDPFMALRAQYPGLTIAFVEGANVDDRILARVTGANLTLPRPLTRHAVIEALARASGLQ